MLEAEFLGNSLKAYLAAGGTFLAVFLAVLLLRRAVLDRLRSLVQKLKWDPDGLVVDLLNQFRLPESLFLALYLGTRPLELPAGLNQSLYIALLLVLTYRAVRILQDLAGFAVRRAVLPEGMAGRAHHDTVRNISYLSNALIWIAGVMFALGTMGINVTALVTGLGIGGVAVALAAQAVLSDLFSALAIFLDKPFVVGDAIVVDSLQGTVEHIGIKTTRVRALTGEMLIFPNSALTSSRIRNFQHLRVRRVEFKFGVARETSLEKIQKTTELIRGIVSKTPKVKLDRAHFKGIGEFSLDFEVVYHVLDADYNRYMDLNEAIQLAILAGLRNEGVGLASPAHRALW
jgi:small-conductance mechanosensitive channel